MIEVLVPVMFRVAGLMAAVPLLPWRVKVLAAPVLALGLSAGISQPVELPTSASGLVMGLGGELALGLAMGWSLSLMFVAFGWAGSLIGQQMGMDAGQVFDPETSGHGSAMGQMYVMFSMTIFLLCNGHHAVLRGLRDSIDTVPLLSASVGRPMLGLFIGVLESSTALALKLAAPVLLTMLAVDLALGFVGRTVPQLQMISAGLALRSALGAAVLIAALAMTSRTVRDSLQDSMQSVTAAWTRTG